MKHTWWELMQIQKYPELTPQKAIAKGKEDMANRSRGNSGNPNPHLKDNPDKASEIGTLGSNKRWSKNGPKN